MKIGEKYKTRDGSKVFTIFRHNQGTTRPVVAIDSKNRFQNFTNEGHFIDNKTKHELDLVEKVHG